MTFELTIPGDLADARRVQELIEEALQASGRTERHIFALKLAVEESLVNAIKYGNRMDPDKRVRIVYTVTPERFSACVIAEGNGFGPSTGSGPSM